jgi:hypothetical protein
MKRLRDAALALLFLLGTTTPSLLWLAGRGGNATAENRPPAPPPEWKITRDFPRQFDAYFSDRFGLRNDLVHAYGWLKVEAFHKSPTPDVVLGLDGWLYYAGCNSFDDFLGRRPFSADDLEYWRRALERRRDRLAKQGIAYIFVVAPNKQTIYPEHLPAELNHPGRTRLDQLMEHLRAHSDAPVLDLRPLLRQARQRELIYRLGDTHWNDRAAHAVYEAILTPLAERFSTLKPEPRERFTEHRVVCEGGDLAGMLGLAATPRDERIELTPLTPRRAVRADAGMQLREKRRREQEPPSAWEVDDASLPRAVVLHDSFGLNLKPFLAEHFRRSLFLWLPTLDEEVLQRERPDVVIQEVCERFLLPGVKWLGDEEER